MVFKQQLQYVFTVPGWFITLTNAKFSQEGCINGCLHLCAQKKCPPLKHGIENSQLAQWLGENTGLTSELAKKIVKLFSEQHAQYTCNGTTWNKATKQAHQSASCMQSPHWKSWHPTQSKFLAFSNEWLTSHSKLIMQWSSMSQQVMLLDQAHSW